MPVKFKDVNKAANDLLSNDYVFEAQKLKIKTKTANGVEFTTEGTLKGAKGASGKLTAKFDPFPGISIKKLCVTTEGRFQTEASLNDAMEGVTFTVKAEEGAEQPPAGELCVDFEAGNTTVNASVDVCDANGPTLWGASTFKYESFLVGGEVKYSTGYDSKDSSPSVVDYNGAISYLGPDFVASVHTKKKASDITFSYHQSLSKQTTVASTYHHPSRLLTFGALYKMDASSTFQGKLNSKGVVSANAIQTVSPGVKLIASAELDAKNFAGDSHKFGLQLVLG